MIYGGKAPSIEYFLKSYSVAVRKKVLIYGGKAPSIELQKTSK